MTRSVPPPRATSTAMAPRRAGSRRSWPRSRVITPVTGTRDSRAIPQVPRSGSGPPAGAGRRPSGPSPTRSPKGPRASSTGPQAEVPGASSGALASRGPGHGQLVDPVTEGVAHHPGQRLPVGRGPALLEDEHVGVDLPGSSR